MKKIIGLTGGIASGKTLAANYLEKLGAFIVDADIVAREVVLPFSEINSQIAKLLGKDSLLEDGNLNRKKIKQLIFNDKILLRSYESIIMPAIRKSILDKLKTTPIKASYTLLVAPLLFEKGIYEVCDKTVVIDIDENIQIKRAMSRDNANKEMIEKIVASQMPQIEKNNLADFVITNNSDKKTLYKKLDKLHKEILSL